MLRPESPTNHAKPKPEPATSGLTTRQGPPDEAEKLPADEFDRGLWLPAAVAGSVCVRVEGEVVETASDPLRSATGEQPVVCEGNEEFPCVDHGDAAHVGDFG